MDVPPLVGKGERRLTIQSLPYVARRRRTAEKEVRAVHALLLEVIVPDKERLRTYQNA